MNPYTQASLQHSFRERKVVSFLMKYNLIPGFLVFWGLHLIDKSECRLVFWAGDAALGRVVIDCLNVPSEGE